MKDSELIQAVIAEMSEAEQTHVRAAETALRAMLVTLGQPGMMALALIGAELSET